jgi:uncharacterized protein (TIGR03663 family)
MPAPTFLSQIRRRVRVKHVVFAILILSVVLKFTFQDFKLLHHDEVIHAWFSYKHPMEGTYIYDPVYHDPFLYYVIAGIFALFGDLDFVGRTCHACLGLS